MNIHSFKACRAVKNFPGPLKENYKSPTKKICVGEKVNGYDFNQCCQILRLTLYLSVKYNKIMKTK